MIDWKNRYSAKDKSKIPESSLPQDEESLFWHLAIRHGMVAPGQNPESSLAEHKKSYEIMKNDSRWVERNPHIKTFYDFLVDNHFQSHGPSYRGQVNYENYKDAMLNGTPIPYKKSTSEIIRVEPHAWNRENSRFNTYITIKQHTHPATPHGKPKDNA